MITICYIFSAILAIGSLLFRKLYQIRIRDYGLDEVANDYYVFSRATMITAVVLFCIATMLLAMQMLM